MAEQPSPQNPPQRPRRVAVDVLLIIGAMLLLVVYLGLYANNRTDVLPWLDSLVRGNELFVIVGFPLAAIVLLAASLVVRARRR